MARNFVAAFARLYAIAKCEAAPKSARTASIIDAAGVAAPFPGSARAPLTDLREAETLAFLARSHQPGCGTRRHLEHHAQEYGQPRRQIRPRRDPPAPDRHPGDRPPDADPARPRRAGRAQYGGLRDRLPRLAHRLSRVRLAARQRHPGAQPHQVHGRPQRGPGRHRALGHRSRPSCAARASTTAYSASGTARAPASTARATSSATPTTRAPPRTAACWH